MKIRLLQQPPFRVRSGGYEFTFRLEGDLAQRRNILWAVGGAGGELQIPVGVADGDARTIFSVDPDEAATALGEALIAGGIASRMRLPALVLRRLRRIFSPWAEARREARTVAAAPSTADKNLRKAID